MEHEYNSAISTPAGRNVHGRSRSWEHYGPRSTAVMFMVDHDLQPDAPYGRYTQDRGGVPDQLVARRYPTGPDKERYTIVSRVRISFFVWHADTPPGHTGVSQPVARQWTMAFRRKSPIRVRIHVRRMPCQLFGGDGENRPSPINARPRSSHVGLSSLNAPLR